MTAGGDWLNSSYICIDDLHEDMGHNGGGDTKEADVLGRQDMEMFEYVANRMDQDDVLFWNPMCMENFKEMKQAAFDPLYKDFSEHWTLF